MAATCCHKLPLTEEVVQGVAFLFLFAACLNGHTDLRVDESMKMQMDGSLNKCMDEYVNENVEGRTCER